MVGQVKKKKKFWRESSHDAFFCVCGDCATVELQSEQLKRKFLVLAVCGFLQLFFPDPNMFWS